MSEYSNTIAFRLPRRQKEVVQDYARKVGCSPSDLFRAAVALVLRARAEQLDPRVNVLREVATALSLGPDASASETITALEALVAEIEAETGGPNADALQESPDAPAPAMKLGKSKCVNKHCRGDACNQDTCSFSGSTAAIRALTKLSNFAPSADERRAMSGLDELQRENFIRRRLSRRRDAIIAASKGTR